MSALTIPRHQRAGCLYEFPPAARAALMHERYATLSRVYAELASDVDAPVEARRYYRERARHYAGRGREYFAQWIEAKR